MRQRLAPVVVALVVAVATIFGLLVRPATGAPRNTVDYVLIAGAPGLRWDDLSPTETPALWALAEQGAIGALAVRSARTPTCPADGWITLGAGNYAQRTTGAVTPECPPVNVVVQTPDRTGAFLPDQQQVVVNNKKGWGAVPGALAESVRCSVAVGPGAAVAAARPYGRVDRYVAALPEQPAPLLASCVLSFVDLGTVAGEDPAKRRAATRHADEVLAAVLAARPDRALVIVAGLADTDPTSRLHVAIANGPGYGPGWLTSSTTGRPGYLQLTDLAPTVLAALDEPPPQGLFVGHPAERIDGRPAELERAVAGLADADREAGAQHRVAWEFFAVLAVVQVLLFLAAVPLLRRARRHGWPNEPPRRLTQIVEVLLVAAALAVPAALIADAVPWWRSGRPGLLFALVTLGVLVVLTAAVRLGPLWRRTTGPLVAAGAVAAAIVAVDLMTGARLQLNGVAGYSALEGTRYAGVGAVGLGVFVGGLLLAAGCLAQQASRDWRTSVVAIVGGFGVVLVGSPYLGADAGGAIALTAGVCIAAALATGGWLTFTRLVWATLAGLTATAGFALVDLRRPVEERGTLGRFITQLNEGTGGPLVNRAGAGNVVTFVTSPLTVLAITSALFVWFALLRPWGGLRRLFGLYPAVRAAFVGVTVASVVAGLFNVAALNVAGAAVATVVPLAALAALRVLDHADDRTGGDPPRIDAPVPVSPAPGATPHRAAQAPPGDPVDVLP